MGAATGERLGHLLCGGPRIGDSVRIIVGRSAAGLVSPDLLNDSLLSHGRTTACLVRPARRLPATTYATDAVPRPPTYSARGYPRGLTVLAVDHVQIAAPRGCEEEARRFYGELLGLPELSKPEALRVRGGVWFAVGSQQLHIGVEEGFQPARKAHPALRVDAPALNRLAARLKAAGAKVRWDDELPGVRRFYTEDPWGNRVELLA
jgi:catechol 2,3-dioxygenase-like lactoylglutathione lyase family enzyme